MPILAAMMEITGTAEPRQVLGPRMRERSLRRRPRHPGRWRVAALQMRQRGFTRPTSRVRLSRLATTAVSGRTGAAGSRILLCPTTQQAMDITVGTGRIILFQRRPHCNSRTLGIPRDPTVTSFGEARAAKPSRTRKHCRRRGPIWDRARSWPTPRPGWAEGQARTLPGIGPITRTGTAGVATMTAIIHPTG